MDQTTSTLSTNTLHCALELSKNSRLLAIQFWDREQPSLYPIEGGNTGELAVCAGSCGPGNLHLINGLFDCHRSHVPVLAIAAHIPTAEMHAAMLESAA